MVKSSSLWSRDLSCFNYFCHGCWEQQHVGRTQHKPLMRNIRFLLLALLLTVQYMSHCHLQGIDQGQSWPHFSASWPRWIGCPQQHLLRALVTFNGSSCYAKLMLFCVQVVLADTGQRRSKSLLLSSVKPLACNRRRVSVLSVDEVWTLFLGRLDALTWDLAAFLFIFESERLSVWCSISLVKILVTVTIVSGRGDFTDFPEF